MKRSLLAVLVLVWAAGALAQETAPSVETMTFCTAVEERQPVAADTTFAADTEKVYCFTKILGVQGESTVTHVWFRGDKEMARVELSVRSASWSTWSSKRLLPEWAGTWRVDVLDASGSVLQSQEFTLAEMP
jgi:hypothetical protein